MSTIVTRAGKGFTLSWNEVDANFINLNTDKVDSTDIGVSIQPYSANLTEYAAVNPTTAGLALLDDVDAAAQRTTLGLGNVDNTSDATKDSAVSTLTNKTITAPKIKAGQFGDSGTATNNFTITAEAADGTMKLARGNAGATTQDILTVDAAGKVAFPQNTKIAFTGRQAGPTSAGFVMTSLTDIVAETNVGNAWNPATDRFLPTVEGWYQFNFRVNGQTSVAANYFGVTIRKNAGGAGNQVQQYVAPYSTSLYGQPAISGIFYMNGTTDYVQFLVDAAGGAGTLNWSDAMVSAALLEAA
jgi:hypothetical protein